VTRLCLSDSVAECCGCLMVAPTTSTERESARLATGATRTRATTLRSRHRLESTTKPPELSCSRLTRWADAPVFLQEPSRCGCCVPVMRRLGWVGMAGSAIILVPSACAAQPRPDVDIRVTFAADPLTLPTAAMPAPREWSERSRIGRAGDMRSVAGPEVHAI
jgi:hypothetical protein